MPVADNQIHSEDQIREKESKVQDNYHYERKLQPTVYSSHPARTVQHSSQVSRAVMTVALLSSGKSCTQIV
jgi:hypothetical protein